MKLFNKTLIAAAVTAVSATAIAATSFDAATVGKTVGLENASQIGVSGVNLTLPIIVDVLADAKYANVDKLRFTLAGGTLDFGTTVTVNVDGTGGTACTDVDGGGADFEVFATTLVSDTVIEVNLDGGGDPAAMKACLAGNDTTIDFQGTAVLDEAVVVDGATVSMTYEAISTTFNQVADTNSAVLLTVGEQLEVNITGAFDNEISVGDDKTLFVGGVNDTIVLDWNDTAADISAHGAVSKVTYNVMGDFSFLDADADGTIDTNATLSVSVGSVNSSDLSNLVVTHTSLAPITLTIDPSGDAVIPTQAITIDTEVNFATVATDLSTSPSFPATALDTVVAVSGGAWDLNGTSKNISYMPYGENVSQIIYLTNSGSVEGAISYVAYDEAGTKFEGTLPSMTTAKGITQLAGELKTDLATQGFTAGKLNITITVNAPSGQITAYAAYNVGGTDRGFVSNN